MKLPTNFKICSKILGYVDISVIAHFFACHEVYHISIRIIERFYKILYDVYTK